MGAGASAGLVAAAGAAEEAELRACFQAVGEAERQKLSAALCSLAAASEGAAPAPGSAAAGAAASADGGAGGAEIQGGEELAFELNEDELLFRKCMRRRLEREAEAKLAKQQKKEMDEKKRREAFELAFDGEVDKLLDFFAEGFPVDAVDRYGTSLLSEAAAGGSENCIEVLLGNGADVNNIGSNRRTPLWRAANAGHPGAVQMLLRAGGDPRTPDEAGAKPYHVANGAEVKSLLECWDVSVTEKIAHTVAANNKKVQKEREEKESRQKSEMEDALQAAQRKVQIAKTEVARVQKLVATYRQERLGLVEMGSLERMKDLEPLLARAEAELSTAKSVHQDLEWQLRRARLKLRDFESKLRRAKRKEGEEVSLLQQLIWLKDLADVVVRDVGARRREDGRWPLIFDPTGKSVTFFTYSGAAHFSADELALLSISEQKEEQRRLLLALLKHLKYGGGIFVSLGDDLAKMAMVEEAFNCIERGLFNTLTDRSVLYSYLLPRRFLHLVPPDVKNEYSELMFDDELLSKFVLGFVVVAEEPEREVMEKACHVYYCVKVQDPYDREEQ